MLLSIIVPVYNAAPYLEECLHSLLEQDIPAAEYEIICVNDGSIDGSDVILCDFAARYPNLIPIHQENSGVATARNVGLAAAQGEYIWFVDADDFIRPNVLARFLAVLAETGCDQLVVGGYQFSQDTTEDTRALLLEKSLPDTVPGPSAVVWRSLIRRDFLMARSIAFRHPELTHGEDGQFMFELSLENPACIEIPDTVYFYRIRPGSAETSADMESLRKKLRSHIAVTKIMLEYYQSGRTDSGTSNRLMSVLWSCLYGMAKLPLGEARKNLGTLHAYSLFPFRRPESCTMTCSYVTDTGSFIGKLFDWTYMHLHTRWGFALMWLLYHCRPNQ